MAIYWDFYEIDGKDYKALCVETKNSIFEVLRLKNK